MKYLLFCTCILMCSLALASPKDSLRLQRLQGKTFIIHRVEKGEGLYAIARKYGVDVDLLIEANGNKSTALVAGRELKVPLAQADSVKVVLPVFRTELVKLEQPRKNVLPEQLDEAHANAESGEAQYPALHLVTTGETVARIALRYRITLAELIKWNGIRDNLIEVGQGLIVSAGSAMKPYEAWNMPNSLTSISLTELNPPLSPDNVEQSGFATLMQDSGFLHEEAPVGTLLLVVNLDNGQQCFTRVTGNFHSNDIVAKFGESIKSALKADNGMIRVAIRYVAPSLMD